MTDNVIPFASDCPELDRLERCDAPMLRLVLDEIFTHLQTVISISELSDEDLKRALLGGGRAENPYVSLLANGEIMRGSLRCFIQHIAEAEDRMVRCHERSQPSAKVESLMVARATRHMREPAA